jgi:hypothetical protein
MHVELHVFSGRPNPRMELGEQQVKTLRELQLELSATSHPPSVAPGLGYAGFSYSDREGLVVAYDGYVRIGRRVLDDPTMRVERFLLDQLPEEFASVRERIRAQLDRSQR